MSDRSAVCLSELLVFALYKCTHNFGLGWFQCLYEAVVLKTPIYTFVCACVCASICLYIVYRLRAPTHRHAFACISHTSNQLAGDLLHERKKVKYAKSRGYNLSVAYILYSTNPLLLADYW